jgi:hypothetical protein
LVVDAFEPVRSTWGEATNDADDGVVGAAALTWVDTGMTVAVEVDEEAGVVTADGFMTDDDAASEDAGADEPATATEGTVDVDGWTG